MDGFVTDYISTLTVELGRQPTYEEHSQVMTGFTPEQIPVLSGLARGFGVFDHWFCPGTRGLSPGRLACPGARRGDPRCRPAVLDPGR